VVDARRVVLTGAWTAPTGTGLTLVLARPYRSRAACGWRQPAARYLPGRQHQAGRALCGEFLGEQADVPAEQPAPGEDPRVPAAHAHPGRARHSRRAAAQGPRSALGLTRRLSVLPAAARMRARTEFTATVRGGVRAAAPALVVHLSEASDFPERRVGFVVSRAVGGAVVRNRVRRRLRHLMRQRLDQLPAGARLVIRANPAAAARSSADLAADLDRAIARVSRPVVAR
jgi:ribonuclease P protein component